MKIMFLGAATSNHTIRWVNALSKKGHDVLLICRGDQKDVRNEISKTVKIHYLHFGGGLGYYLNVPELAIIYKKYKPDIVNSHYATGYSTLARLAGCRPLVVSCWGSDVYKFPYDSKRNKKLLSKNLNSADAVAATSIAMGEQAKLFIKSNDKSVTITPFGVDTKKFAPVEHELHDRPIIGFVKYLEPIYDVPLLLNAFCIICKNAEKKPLLHIYGDGSLRSAMEQLAEELGISKDVVFWGTIPNRDVPKALSTFDVFVNCSKQESFGVALVEAMSCEIPVVCTSTPGFKEVVADGKTGEILKTRDPKEMATVIDSLLKDEKKRGLYGKAGRERVLELYDWDKNVKVMESLYYETSKKWCKK